jgi:hypothetical protein
MKPVSLLFLLFLTLNQGVAQLFDNFSDGNFTENPSWQGDQAKFIIENEVLRLFDQTPESSNTSFLSVPAQTSSDQETTWEFYLRMEFAPSVSNFSRIYLSASNSDLSGDQNGYFIKAGGISGGDDAIELFRQNGGSNTLLFSGTIGAVGADPAMARLRIIRSTDGEWSIFADYTGGTNFQLEGSVTDNTYSMGAFAGFYCKYTSTRNEDFYFDDMLIDPLYQDTQGPDLQSAEALSSTKIALTFNESVSSSSAENINNYSIDNGIGNPTAATISIDNPNIAELEFTPPLTNLVTYTVTASNIEDIVENISIDQTAEFTFFNIQPAVPYDILITEIMADPNPKPEGLPEAEYLELFNNSDKVIQLETLKLVINGAQKSFPEHFLLPGEYLTICEDEFLSSFENFGQAVAFSSIPALTNGSGQLIIKDDEETVIFEVNYSKNWYGDADKTEGGWSLELIDLNGIHDCGGNWRASVDSDGGTPGNENSLFGTALETAGPVMRSAFAESGFEVLITFNEAIDETTISSASFTISDGITIFNAFVQQPETNTVLLTLSSPLSFGVIYSLTGMGDIADCLGNQLQSEDPVYFGLTESIEPNDIVINEILFNPETFGSDFLELYNRSNKIIDLDDITIINFQKEDTAFVKRHVIFPNEYAVISEARADIIERYFVEFPERIFENDLPGFDDKAGNVTIQSSGITIDSFDYSEGMHFGLLSDKDGISLERTSPETSTQSFGNWHSAASAAGYATPTYKNSQFTIPAEAGSSIMSIPNTTFSPDNDGYEDILQINYATDQSGYFINIFIYDAMGRQIKQIAANELLASEGVYKWDGTTGDGQKARLGIYVVWAELFTTEGQVEQFKETCVLAGKLD